MKKTINVTGQPFPFRFSTFAPHVSFPFNQYVECNGIESFTYSVPTIEIYIFFQGPRNVYHHYDNNNDDDDDDNDDGNVLYNDIIRTDFQILRRDSTFG